MLTDNLKVTDEIVIEAGPELETYVNTAFEAGCPADQLENFIQAGYVAQPKQLEFHAAARQCDEAGGPVKVAQGGTRGSAKTHAAFAQVALDDCQRVAGLKWLFLRNIKKAATESFGDLVLKILYAMPHEFAEGKIGFPNGSRIIVGGFKDEKDIDKYLGIEYDGIVIEEPTLLSQTKADKVEGSLRTTMPGWRARMYLGTNPGGIGHLWFREMFVLPWREGRERETRFISSTYRDNAFLAPEYVAYLERLTGDLRRIWTEADWDAFEGQVVGEWRHELHVIDVRDLPEDFEFWPKWRALDWGLAAPFCCLFFARDPDTGRVYVYRELYRAGMNTKRQAGMIVENSPPGENLTLTYADPSLWSKKDYKGKVISTADEMRLYGAPLTKAENDRLMGVRKVHDVLGMLPDGRPGLVIVRENCPNMIRTLPALPRDANRPEDVDTNAEDHGYDTLRYGLTNLVRQTKQKRKVRYTGLDSLRL